MIDKLELTVVELTKFLPLIMPGDDLHLLGYKQDGEDTLGYKEGEPRDYWKQIPGGLFGDLIVSFSECPDRKGMYCLNNVYRAPELQENK